MWGAGERVGNNVGRSVGRRMLICFILNSEISKYKCSFISGLC